MESLAGLPIWIQYAAIIGVLIGAGLIGAKGFASRAFKSENNNHDQQLILEGASISDMAPIRKAIEWLERIAKANERMADAAVETNKFLRERYDAEQRRIEIANAVAEAESRRQKRRERSQGTD